jgi:hypothetical protein
MPGYPLGETPEGNCSFGDRHQRSIEMKKIIVVMVLLVAALAVSVPSIAFAQTAQPPVPGTSVEGPLHDYMVNAMAAALGITPTDFEARQAAGKTAYQIALDLGISADKIPALLAGARAKALDEAAAAGVITQQQATWMKSRGAGMGLGNCTGTGQRMGGGMMGRGDRWQQTNP